jgi:hypothetical protein
MKKKKRNYEQKKKRAPPPQSKKEGGEDAYLNGASKALNLWTGPTALFRALSPEALLFFWGGGGTLLKLNFSQNNT